MVGLSCLLKVRETAPISAHATASELEEALSDLSNIPNITASVRTPEGFNGNKSWFVTFTSLANAGDVPLMDIDVSGCSGTGVAATVAEYVKGNSLGIRKLEILNADANDKFVLSFNYVARCVLSQ